MKCKVCGAYNEDYLEYCENCAAPLTPDEPEPAPAEDSYVASTGETPPAWGFVRAPQWPKQMCIRDREGGPPGKAPRSPHMRGRVRRCSINTAGI